MPLSTVTHVQCKMPLHTIPGCDNRKHSDITLVSVASNSVIRLMGWEISGMGLAVMMQFY